MKKINIIFISLMMLILCVSCQSRKVNDGDLSLEKLEATVKEAVPAEYGYCDVTDYYKPLYFSSLDGIEDCKIYKCNESTDFNEFGIFKFSSESAANKAPKIVKSYLKSAKENFENGVIYDITEYPKFKDSSCEVYGKYLIYTIMTKKDAESIHKKINKGL